MTSQNTPSDTTHANGAVGSDAFLHELLRVVDRIAASGDLSAVDALMDRTADTTRPPLHAALTESFARMVVTLEAREFELENTIQDLRATRAELETASYDALTDLPNRVIGRDRLQQAMTQVRRNDGLLAAALYLDLDRFKTVNDRLGHAAGDELLQQVAQRCRASLREGDTFARMGGDEFLCVLPGLGQAAQAEELAARLVQTLALPFALAAGAAHIGASVGIALYPAHGGTLDALLAAADRALYAAKNAGRNAFRVYQPADEAAHAPAPVTLGASDEPQAPTAAAA